MPDSLLIGLNIQIFPIDYYGQSTYADVIGMNYKFHSKSHDLIVHKAISTDISALKLSNYDFIYKLINQLDQPKWTSKHIELVINNQLLVDILNYWLPYWAGFKFPTSKYDIRQWLRIMRFKHQHHLVLDLVPADFSNPKRLSRLESIYHSLEDFACLKIESVDTTQAKETLELHQSMKKALHGLIPRKDESK